MSESVQGERPAWASLLRRLPHLERLLIYTAPATAEGLDAVVSLGFSLENATPAHLTMLESVRRRHQVDPLRALMRRGLRGWFAMDDGRFAGHAFLAVARDRRERFGGVWLHPGEMAIVSLYVDPSARGRGLGGALHRQLVANAVRDVGSTTNIAWTADYNLASQRMLIKHGCRQVGTIDRLIVWYRPLVSIYRGAPPRR